MNSTLPLIQLIQKHHVFCLASQGTAGPHATPLFYAFDAETRRFIFSSESSTRHIQEIAVSPSVAASIYLETEEIGLIQGAQIWGRVNLDKTQETREIYFKRFPFSRAFLLAKPAHQFYTLQMRRARLIDNKLGFGKKMEWSFEEGKEDGPPPF
ncbi:MAG: pyridoxamine 5'-phosphate oxidase family protein [Deltaproteobacteria bacterium]|nr:pyridoxamine 5'-phosphate oxidase family protein [Deltaproteobacteria bacterium]